VASKGPCSKNIDMCCSEVEVVEAKFSVLPKRLAGKNVSKMTCLVLSGTLNF